MIAQTLTLRVLSEEALLIIQQLVRIHQLEVLPATSASEATSIPATDEVSGPARRWYGMLSKERGEQLQREVEEMRNEWDRGF